MASGEGRGNPILVAKFTQKRGVLEFRTSKKRTVFRVQKERDTRKTLFFSAAERKCIPNATLLHAKKGPNSGSEGGWDATIAAVVVYGIAAQYHSAAKGKIHEQEKRPQGLKSSDPPPPWVVAVPLSRGPHLIKIPGWYSSYTPEEEEAHFGRGSSFRMLEKRTRRRQFNQQ